MKKIIIFGAGAAGTNLLLRIDKNNVAFFVDNNKAMRGKEIDGIRIISVEDLRELYNSEKHIIVVSAEGYFGEIRKQLDALGVSGYVKASHFLLERKMKRNGKRRIVLANTHMGTNVGDHLITFAEMKFFEKYLEDFEVIELTASEIEERFDEISEYIFPEDIIAISGGGYMGSLWPIYGEYNVRRIISDLPHNRIIIMPQSIFYEDTAEGKKQLQISSKIFCAHRNLTVCIREPERLANIKSLFNNRIDMRSYPDMVFSMDRIENCLVRKGIGICFRTDKESVITEEKKHEIIKFLDDEITYFDMHTDRPVTGMERSECVKKYISMISGFRYVITDRLHCMLTCMITGTPCIVFDNLTGKISAVYRWMDESSYINIANTVLEAETYIEQYADNEVDKWCNWNGAYNRFEDLAKEFQV